MYALILGTAAAEGSDDLARPIAGAPLLARQLELLRANGVTRVVINRVADAPLADTLRGDAMRSVGLDVIWIPSTAPLSRRELAQRSECGDALVIVLAHGRVGDVDLRAAMALAQQTGEDVEARASHRGIEVWHPRDASRGRRVLNVDGWTLDVHDERTAQSLTEEILAGHRSGIEVRGSEITPGVWTSRGASISREAIVEAPCYFGPGAYVASGARVGPGAILGEGAVVEEGALVRHARVADRVVVGRGLRLEHACALPGRLAVHEGASLELEDELLIGERRSNALPSRIAAAAALGALAPAAFAFGGAPRAAARRLARVVAGRGSWLGVRGGDPDAAVFDVESLLVPPNAQAEDRALARAFYDAEKSLLLDAKLLFSMLAGGGR